MSTTAEALRKLHRIHRQLTDLKQRLERGPRQVLAAEANAKRLEQEVADAKEKLTRAKVTVDDKELQLGEREAKIEDLSKKLNVCNSNKEYQALKEQIAADEQANSVLSDEILEGYDKIELLERKSAEVVDQHEKAVAELANLRGRVNGEHDDLTSELQRVEQSLVRAESTLPYDLKQDYLRLSRSRGEDSMASIEHSDGEVICEGCNQVITHQMYDQLRCEKLVYCKACGRLLYVPEETKVGG